MKLLNSVHLKSKFLVHLRNGIVVLSLGLTKSVEGEEPKPFDHAAYEAQMEKHLAEVMAKIDPALPDYKPAPDLAGQITILGVDQLNNVLTLAAERFRKLHPKVQFEIEGQATSTAPPRLYGNTISFGKMSRHYNERELKPFLEKYGYEPTYFLVTWDVLAVLVHKDNPLKSLTLNELDAVFTNERRRGHPNDITTWGQLGLDGEWSARAITLHGRNAASGAFGCFQRTALAGAQPKQTYVMHDGSRKTVEAISADPAAIGFTGIDYQSEGVRAVPIVPTPGGPAVMPTFTDASSGSYPLGQPLYLVLNHKPGEKLDPLRAAFLEFIYSKTGQAMVAIGGYSPLPAAVAKGQLQQIREKE